MTGGWSRTWAGIRYANVGCVTISDPNCHITVGVMLGFALIFSVFFYSQDLNKEETMVFDAHGM